MKKISLSLFTVALILTGLFIFAGCEKEENSDIRPKLARDNGDCPTCSALELPLDSMVYVQNHYFIDNYGIDIHEFSSNANFQQLITEINDMTSDINEFMANASLEQLEDSRLFLEQKAEELRINEDANNTSGMLSVAKVIFATLMPTKPLNEYIYEGNAHQLPADYLEMKTDAISNAFHQLETRFPSLQDMPEEDFQKLLEIGFITSRQDGNEGLCFDKGPTNGSNSNTQTKANMIEYEKCIQKAKAEFAIAEVAAVGVLTVKEIKSAGLNTLGPLGTSIYVVKSAQYITQFGITTYSAYKVYTIRIDNCRLKYKQ